MAKQISVTGVVQGVGFRPFVYGLATRLDLPFWVTLPAGGLRLSPADVEADAVERVLRRPGEGESPWAKSYREAALHAPVRTTRDLLTFETPHVRDVSCLPNYRRDLFLEARQALRDGLELFECEAAGG